MAARGHLLLLSLAVVGTISAAGTYSTKNNYQRDENGFKEWCSVHGKKYESETQKASKYVVWLNNYETVEAVNHANTTWSATIDTHFADLTPKEFKETILLRPFDVKKLPKHKVEKKISSLAAKVGIEDAFDWRDYGAVTPVHDQGSVGTCWAFSTVGNIEGQWFLAKNELVDLSEEYLVDCDGTHDETHADCGVFGGWPYLAYQYVISSGGIPTEETDPYCAGTGDCFPCMQGPISLCGPPPYYCEPERTAACPNQELHAHISDWTTVSTDESIIRSSLADMGPLSALLDATQLQFYDSGVWTGKASDDANDFLGCHGDYLDHAVLLVGYGTDSASGLPYWTVKNSWGEQWGEDGYFRILRGEGTCGINTAVTSSLVNA